MSFVEKLKALLHEAGAEIKAGEEKLKAYVEAAVTAHEDNKDLPTPTPAAATGSVPYMGANPSPKNQRPLPIQRANKETGITEESSPPPVSNAGHAIAADGTDLGTGQNLNPGAKASDNVVSTTGRLGDAGATTDGHKLASGATGATGAQTQGHYEDQYPGKSNDELLADYKAAIDEQNKFVANLQPGEYIGATPNWATAKNNPANPDKSRDISKERDDIRYKITSLATAITHRGLAVPAGDTTGRKNA